MPTPKETARIKDKKDAKRIKDLARELFKHHKSISDSQIFNSEEIPKTLKETPISSNPSLKTALDTLPLNSLLYSKVLVRICKFCISDGRIIEPYLRRNTILPILNSPLSEYRTTVQELILRYPHIDFYSYQLYRDANICGHPDDPICQARTKKEDPCPIDRTNYRLRCENIIKNVNELPANQKSKDAITKYLKTKTFPSLFPVFNEEEYFLQQIEEQISNRRIDLLKPLTLKAFLLSGLKDSTLFKAIPELNQDFLQNMGNALQTLELYPELQSDNRDIMEEKIWVANALGITYNPEMPVEQYLDIVLPRKAKINSLIERFIKKNEDGTYKSINDEIWKINKEIATSKKIEMYDYLTTFASTNKSLITGLILGGSIGFATASLIGCGFEGAIASLSSIGGSIAGKTAARLGLSQRIKAPKPPKKTIEWLKEKIETPQEKMLAAVLSKDVPLIQIWALRKKLNK